MTVFSAPDTVPGGLEGALARADRAWRAEEYPAATTLYQAIVERDSSAPTIAIFRLATLRAWDDRLDEAVGLFRRYVALEPRDTEGRLALSRALAWGGHFNAALAVYDSVLAEDSTYRDAVIGRGEALAWAGRLREALTTYERWLATHPLDRDAILSYARALSWSGRLDEAEVLYTKLAGAGDVQAQKGLARVIGWRGELHRSEWAWRQIIESRPTDPEALTGLAQILRWQGRPMDAKAALLRALRADPGYGDARALLRIVQTDLRPVGSTTMVSATDSDKNRATTLSVDYAGRAWWNGTLGGRYTERRADLGSIDSRARSITVSASWQPRANAWRLGAEGGIARHSSSLRPSSAPRPTLGSGMIRLNGVVGRSISVGVAASRAPFDETAVLIANGIVMSELSAEAAVVLPARFNLSGGASYARMTGGARENARRAASTTLRWTAGPRWSVAVGARQFAYDAAAADGYFAPRRYTLAEGSARGRLGGDLRWVADADVALGRQRIALFGSDATSRRAERIAASVGYRFDPAREVSIVGTYANVAGPGQSGTEYRAASIALRARVGF